MVVGITHCELRVHTTVMQFSILVKKYDIFEKPPQLNFSQASWLVSMDSHKVINNVSTDKSEWCVTVDRNICWIRVLF